MGVPTFRFKLLAFAMGASIGGLAGALFAGQAGFISPDQLPDPAVDAVPGRGGHRWPGNRWGAIVGAVVVAYLPERFRGSERLAACLIFGLALMVLAIFRPQGLLPPRRTHDRATEGRGGDSKR